METIINFMEHYWGYTLVGGMTLGTIVTFIVVQVRYMIKDSKKNVVIKSLMDTAYELIAVNKAEDLAKAELLAKDEYMEKSMALLFKYVQYITMASKLPLADKQALQAESTQLVLDYKQVLAEFAAAAAAEIVEDVVEGDKIDAEVIMDIAARGAKTLLDKYTPKGE